MGTIVYQNLLNLLLDEQDYSLDEILRITHERYGFDPEKTRFEIKINISICRDKIQLLPNQKYHKTGEFCDTSRMLGFIEKAPEGYFDGRLGLKKFYQELKKRYS